MTCWPAPIWASLGAENEVDTLEQLYGVDAENHAAGLAHHFVQAGPVLGPEKLVSYSPLAGERGLESYTYSGNKTFTLKVSSSTARRSWPGRFAL